MQTRQTSISEFQDTSWISTTATTRPSTNGYEAGEGRIGNRYPFVANSPKHLDQTIMSSNFMPPAEPLKTQLGREYAQVYCNDKPNMAWSPGLEQIPIFMQKSGNLHHYERLMHINGIYRDLI